jgi:hypothetical protein
MLLTVVKGLLRIDLLRGRVAFLSKFVSMENNLPATITIYYMVIMDGSDQWHTIYVQN